MASSNRPLSAYSSDTCMFCHEELCVTIDTNSHWDLDPGSPPEPELAEPPTFIDDVELYCGPPGSGPSGHYAHWSYLIDHALKTRATSIPGSPLACVVCGQNVRDASGRFIVDVRNEGGETKGFNFGEIIEEECFVESNPEQLRNRAFHDFVAAGDYPAARILVEHEGVDVNCTYGEGLTMLQKAVFSGDENAVEFLRSLGATT